ncbi:hypothetical protein HHK36_020110 [Tetracentron sinense]|uniref:Uncharacterized protein n=1 Tax=Tetracentron sinense TaxID=13715 RepID=A0A834YUI2_TETSI|nr:hypothetical protein HHK36_020110 [Tetracentron sinense]
MVLFCNLVFAQFSFIVDTRHETNDVRGLMMNEPIISFVFEKNGRHDESIHQFVRLHATRVWVCIEIKILKNALHDLYSDSRTLRPLPFASLKQELLVRDLIQATPRLSEDKVKQCVDPKLKGEFSLKGVAKVSLSLLSLSTQHTTHLSILLCLTCCLSFQMVVHVKVYAVFNLKRNWYMAETCCVCNLRPGNMKMMELEALPVGGKDWMPKLLTTSKLQKLTRWWSLLMQLAAVAALCVQYESEFRPNMSIVVKALQPLLTQRPPAPAPEI